MYQTISTVEHELAYQQKLKRKYLKKLKGLPRGALYLNHNKGHDYFFMQNEGIRTYLGDASSPEVQQLQQRKYLETAIRQIDVNCEAMSSFLKKYADVDPFTISQTLPKAYQSLPDSCYDIANRRDLDKWEKAPYKKYDGFPEQLTKRTLKGEYVRSKSELVIANSLFMNNVPYHYEEVVRLSDKLYYPDFRLGVRRTGKRKIWEHIGKSSDSDYLRKNTYKLADYLEKGLVIWEDVILTFDDIYGNIDAKLIDDIIKTFCM